MLEHAIESYLLDFALLLVSVIHSRLYKETSLMRLRVKNWISTERDTYLKRGMLLCRFRRVIEVGSPLMSISPKHWLLA